MTVIGFMYNIVEEFWDIIFRIPLKLKETAGILDNERKNRCLLVGIKGAILSIDSINK